MENSETRVFVQVGIDRFENTPVFSSTLDTVAAHTYLYVYSRRQ